ncbi:MAG: helix-turn-helix transcriptional regulator [Rickettsiales bacterium]|jgi:DNA-binding XRE family transcriptional regulator|nr:helix-turn-helix transcriptional regulator [Rickettsiales bacterium]
MSENKNIGSSLDEFIDECNKDPDFREKYNKQLVINELSRLLVKTRQEEGLTQEELANKINTKQASISRIEKNNASILPSMEFLYKIANALNKKLIVKFE